MIGQNDRRSYGNLKKVKEIYLLDSSLVIRSSRRGLGEEMAGILNGMGWDWDVEFHKGFDKYWSYGWSFKVADSEWRLTLIAVEYRSKEYRSRSVTVLSIALDLFMLTPRSCQYRVVYHPGELRRSETSLGDLLESSLWTMFYVANDLYQLVELSRLMRDRRIIIYHDRRWPKRADVVMSTQGVPYSFTITYHMDAPFVAVKYGITAQDPSSFDILKDVIVEEYWSALIGGGGEG